MFHALPYRTLRATAQLDAFTHTAFGGNSAAVVLLEPGHLPLADAARQAIAMEMNLSETAYLEPVVTDDDGKIDDGADFHWRQMIPSASPICWLLRDVTVIWHDHNLRPTL